MKKVALIGSNSDVAKKLIQETNFEFICLSSKTSDFDVMNTNTFPPIENLCGLVYFPGTINLKPFSNFKLEDFQYDYQVNVIGLINVLQFYQKSFVENSAVVTISSIAANIGMPFHTSISMCKASVEALTRSLAAEWAPKIRLNCIAPSITATKLSERLINSDLKRQTLADRHPLKKIGETEDLSNLIAFLLSDKASWITGQTIGVDGGLSKLK
ncbi:MAG: oxidoreductase [Flavobacteriales bacterium]|nr:oxidoreductase [Flavobacteriales bacterium]|tara:strand:- start:8774 stop:9415 length:642 start_codon:yes stop_codon:yes gene_type:complete